MPIPRPPFTKRPRPEPDEAKPSPAAEKREREKSVEADREVWEPVLGEDVADSLMGVCEVLAETIGPEWQLEEAKAKRIGERWARLANRFAKRVSNPIVLKALVYGLMFFAFLEVFAFFGGRLVKTIRRLRKEREEKAKQKTVPGRVVPIREDEKEASGGA